MLAADADDYLNPIQPGRSMRSWMADIDLLIQIVLHNNNTIHRHLSSEYEVPKCWTPMPTPIQSGRSIMSWMADIDLLIQIVLHINNTIHWQSFELRMVQNVGCQCQLIPYHQCSLDSQHWNECKLYFRIIAQSIGRALS